MSTTSFKDLIVWQRASELISTVYAIANQLPIHERYGLSSQIRRSAVSIPSNIAEGSKRGSRADFRQFCKIAAGSAAELETQLLVFPRIYPQIEVETALEQLTEVQKMLTVLNQRLDKKL